MTYRKEIDGLRSLAVLPVIFYHAGFSFFSGGFIGVDVFFVISGYLITSLILKEKKEETFSLLNFYERRARRILPALFFVMICCIPFAWIWTLPAEFKDFAQSILATSLFSSNIFFWQGTDYFGGGNVDLKILLHTWSLAVEEQYYLIFPVFIMLTWRLGLKFLVYFFLTFTVLSLGLSHYGSSHFPVANFYLLPSRAWELLLGVLAALYLFSGNENKIKLPSWIKETLGFLGLGMILLTVWLFDKNTPFPSLYALVPTIGTLLLILFSTSTTLLGKFLSLKPLVFTGLISYSLYLWHLPLFVFARHILIEEPNKIILIGLILLSFIFAYISWRFVEKPFRDRNLFSQRKIFLYSLSGIFCFLVIGSIIIFNNGFESSFKAKLSKDQLSLLSLQEAYRQEIDSMYRRGECHLRTDQTYKDFTNSCFGKNQEKDYLIWGDSNAGALFYGLDFYAKTVVQFTSTGCPPFIAEDIFMRPNCREVNDYVINQIKKLNPKKIWLHSDWFRYKSLDPVTKLEKTLKLINEISPSSEVYIVGGVPQWERTLPRIMIKKSLNLNNTDFISTPLLSELKSIDNHLRILADKSKVFFLSPIDFFCKESLCLAVVKLDEITEPIIWDNNHLTKTASKILAEELLSK